MNGLDEKKIPNVIFRVGKILGYMTKVHASDILADIDHLLLAITGVYLHFLEVTECLNLVTCISTRLIYAKI